MRVRFLTSVDVYLSLSRGDVVELPDERALEYLRCGAAEPAEQPPAETAALDSATQTAMRQRAKHRQPGRPERGPEAPAAPDQE